MKLSFIFLCLFVGIISSSNLADNSHDKCQWTLESISLLVKQDLSHLVWKSIIENDEFVDKISSKCKKEVKLHFAEKSENFLTKFSGHFPPKFDRWIYSDFGDYDGCFRASNNKSHEFHYCIMSFEPDFQKFQSHSINHVMIKKLIPFDFNAEYGQSLKIGLCSPQSCSAQDIDSALEHGLIGQFWLKNEAVHCVTERNLLQRYQHSTNEQKISIWVLACPVFLVLWAALQDWNTPRIGPNQDTPVGIIQDIFSPRKTLNDFSTPIGGKRWIFIDKVRFGVLALVVSTESDIFRHGNEIFSSKQESKLSRASVPP